MPKFNAKPLRLYLVAHGFNVPVLENALKNSNKKDFEKESELIYMHPSFLTCLKLCFSKSYEISEIDFITLKNYYPKRSSEIYKLFIGATFLRLKTAAIIFLVSKYGEIIFATLFLVASFLTYYVYRKGDSPITHTEIRLFSTIFLVLFGVGVFSALRLYNAVVNNSKTIAGNYLATKKMLEDFTKKLKK